MTDLLEAASEALGTPTALVKRSAAARAAANGTTAEEILSAWAGGAPVSAPSEPAAAAEPAETPPEPEAEVEPEPQESAVAVLDAPQVAAAPPVPEPEPMEPEPDLEPVPISTRLRTAVRIGAWTGAALGLIGFLVAGAFWAPNAAVSPGEGPVVQVSSGAVILGVALVSLVFGAIVAGMSRAATTWTDPAMQLSSSKTSTTWVGAGLGVVLGLTAGALLTSGFGVPIEGSEGLVELPVLATLFVMIIGGAALGAVTATVPQVFGTPVAMAEDEEEVATVKARLGDAIGVPMAGMILLLLLVLPFAYALIQSSHLVTNGAAVIAIITAGGILGFASLAGSRPHIKISFGELIVALIGIGTVLAIILAVFMFRAGDGHEEEPAPAEPEAAVVLVV